MKKHVKIYLDYFNLGEQSDIQCENCPKEGRLDKGGFNVHHIECRGMGGSKYKDYIENLMMLCFDCHEKYGDKAQYMDMLKEKHKKRINDI